MSTKCVCLSKGIDNGVRLAVSWNIIRSFDLQSITIIKTQCGSVFSQSILWTLTIEPWWLPLGVLSWHPIFKTSHYKSFGNWISYTAVSLSNWCSDLTCLHGRAPGWEPQQCLPGTVAWYPYATHFFYSTWPPSFSSHVNMLIREENNGDHRIKRALYIGIKRLYCRATCRCQFSFRPKSHLCQYRIVLDRVMAGPTGFTPSRPVPAFHSPDLALFWPLTR